MPDPKVERLEEQILALREAFVAFRSDQTLALKDLQASLNQVNGHIADVMLEVGDAPDHRFREAGRPSLRSRVHHLENDRNAEQIARALKGSLWTRGQKVALFAFAAVGAVGVIVRFFIGG